MKIKSFQFHYCNNYSYHSIIRLFNSSIHAIIDLLFVFVQNVASFIAWKIFTVKANLQIGGNQIYLIEVRVLWEFHISYSYLSKYWQYQHRKCFWNVPLLQFINWDRTNTFEINVSFRNITNTTKRDSVILFETKKKRERIAELLRAFSFTYCNGNFTYYFWI